MAETTISWTATRLPDGLVLPGYTWNPWIGCARVSPGCARCYAEQIARNRMRLDVWDGKTAKYRHITSESYWRQPLTWNRKAEREGIRRKVFCASMADVFEDRMALARHQERLWKLIEATPHLDWLLLTKRPENVQHMVPEHWMEEGFPPHVWMGASVENQRWADMRIPILLTIPARIRFLSCEPLLGPVNLGLGLVSQPGVHWIICGGESGAKHRPMKPEWARSLRDQCQDANIPFFFKQWGGATSRSGGDSLDGRQHHEWPEETIYASV